MTNRIGSRLAAAAAAALTLAVVAAPAQAADPAHTRTVVGGGVSTQNDALSPITGSTSYLVYAEGTVTATPNTPGYSVPAKVYTRHADGRTRTMGSLTNVRLDAPVGRWLVGRIIGTRYAAWWDLATGRHGKVRVPKHVDILTAIPGGGLSYISRDGRVHTQSLSGKRAVLGRPFAAEPSDYYQNSELIASMFVSADAHGIALGGDGGAVRYISFSRPGKVRHLTDPLGDDQLCRAVNPSYVGCIPLLPVGQWSGDNPETQGVSLIPLDGATPTTVANTPVGTGGIGLHASRLLWASYDSTTGTSTLHSIDAGASLPQTGTASIGGESPGYDGLVVVTKSGALATATAVDDIRPFRTPRRSPVTATGFALGGSRVVDIDDARHDAQGTNPTLRSRALAATNGRISVGSPTTIAHLSAAGPATTDDFTPILAASSYAVVYGTNDPATYSTTLHVHARNGDSIITDVPPSKDVELSGQRLLYQRYVPHRQYPEFAVRDLASNSDTLVAGTNTAGAISGHFVAQMTSRGAVTRTDLNTGAVRQLAARQPRRDRLNAINIFTHGNEVVWTHNGHTWIRNARTMHAATEMSGIAVGIGAAGVLLADQAYDPIVREATIRVRSWSGHTRTLLSQRRFGLLPQLGSHLVAWVDGAGRLRAAPVQ
ncbi:MAG: hypothetical protein ACTHK4_08710 [Mycobacteriales bacterium]